jgi:hypothetical protein
MMLSFGMSLYKYNLQVMIGRINGTSVLEGMTNVTSARIGTGRRTDRREYG